MSRYVTLIVERATREELCAALEALKIPYEVAELGQVMLEGSLECAGEPVDLRLAPGVAGAVEDFGFLVAETGELRLVCGDVDRRRIERELLAPLRAAVAEARLAGHARATGGRLEVEQARDGSRRLVLRPGRGGAG